MIEIKQLTGIKIETIYEAFNKAFADYVEPFDLSLLELQYMIERRGCDFDLSFGAFNDNELVGFTLNGIDKWNGERTAYDTGTGMVKEFRKRGIATRMFQESLPILKENFITQYLLEVIKTNKGAFDLYKKAGFEVTREFDYFIAPTSDLKIDAEKLNQNYEIREIENPDWTQIKTFWEFNPSWQNSIDSIKRKTDHFKTLGIFNNEIILGYGFIEKHTGDIPQLAIRKEYRRKGLGTTLLHNLLQLNNTENFKIINTVSDYIPFKKFIQSINVKPGFGQYEMLLKL